MRILFLSQRFLLPMDTGGKIRTGNILKHLSKKHDITLISNVESQKDDPYMSQIKQLCNHFIAVPWKEIKRYSPPFFLRLALQMFSVYPVSALNDFSKALARAVENTLRDGQYDLAICDFVQSALMFNEVRYTPTVLFQHNVESTIMRRHLKKAKNPISLFFWFLQWKKMAWFEKHACRRFDKVIAVSMQDKNAFEVMYGLHRVDAISTGVDIDFFKPMPHIREKPNSIIFCGSMDWLPNEDAMVFFINDILPTVKKHVPQATLTIVGRNPTPFLKKMVGQLPDVSLTGWVEDIRPFIAEASVVVVPIRIGGGTRMKIYEAMAMGKPVVSTTIGAEGLPVLNGYTIVMEDNPFNAANEIIALFSDHQRRESIGECAMEFVRDRFAWSKVSAAFETICRKAAFTHRA